MVIVIDNSKGNIYVDDVADLLSLYPNPNFPVDVVDDIVDYGDQIHVYTKGFLRYDTIDDIADIIERHYRTRTYTLD